MFINKIGAQHLEIGQNCQDYGLEKSNVKLVCDGCSEGKHSEVGAKSFCHLADSYTNYTDTNIRDMFSVLLSLFGQTVSSIKDFLCFTILSVYEDESGFILSYCGDGYVILEDMDGNISFEELNDGEYPKYYAYNYCDPEKLAYYKEGVPMEWKVYPKSQYKNVGVASDGLRFLLKSDNEKLKSEFVDLLKKGKDVAIKRFINRNQKIFKDDITIVF